MRNFSMFFVGLSTMLAIAGASSAAAQDMPTVLPQDYVLMDILNQQRIDAAIDTQPGPSANPRPIPQTRPRAQAATAYRSTAAVSTRVRARFTRWVGEQAGAEGGRSVAEAMRRGDPVQNWAQLVASDGLRPGDLADALAGYWILNWIMATGKDGNRTQALAVREQVRSMIAATPAYARFDDARRQEMAELLMLNFLLQHAAYSDAVQRKDRDTARKLGDAAARRFQAEMGLDLRGLELTDKGFVRHG